MIISAKPMKKPPTPSAIIDHLDRSIHGQESAKRALAVAAYNHYLLRAHSEKTGIDPGHHHVLLMGPTGVGKTALVKAMAEFLKVPMGYSSAAGLVEAGYRGASVETVIAAVMGSAGGNPQQAEDGIVFIDEIDKIRRSDSGFRDVSGQGVQNALLTLVDGRLCGGFESYPSASVDTRKMLFICCGAFVGLKEVIRKRLGTFQKTIGFVPEAIKNSRDSSPSDLYQVLPEDLVNFGMIPEFVGRFPNMGMLHDLTQGDLRDIAADTENSPVARQKMLAKIHGIELRYTDEALDAIAAAAAKLGTGARSLNFIAAQSIANVGYRWPELAASGIRSVIIHPDCLSGAEPELLRVVKKQQAIHCCS
jgi:ATP-dependent Clp protease ATP-binding subunit ClpX